MDPIIEVRPAISQVDDLLSEIKKRVVVKSRVLVTTLTKKMSEDLSEYFSEQGIKVRYLHSDIDTVERVEIIRDLRLGVFDVLIGINLLREGLDIPEVSLVAILDADKEGFLRSQRSLIQTIGRAARNIEGIAILYADRETNSMKLAIDETRRRRKKQEIYNHENGMVPKMISKGVKELIDGAMSSPKIDSNNKDLNDLRDYVIPSKLDQKSVSKELARLEKKMLEHARNLEFEKAAKTRNELTYFKEKIFETSS